MMSDDLVKALWKDVADVDRQQEAAARIEELEEKLKTAEEIGRAFEEDTGQTREKLAKAVEALEKVCRLVDEQYSDRLYTQSVAGWEYCADDVADGARTTLAELKGDKT
jgi:hypothetical protein